MRSGSQNRLTGVIRKGTRKVSDMSITWQQQLTVGSLGMLLAITAPSCGSSHKGDEPAVTSGAQAAYAVPVEVATAELKDLTVLKTFSGPLEGEEQANIVARISERVISIKVHVGETVRAGQVVLALDKSGTSSQYYQAEANFKNAGKTLERMKSLYAEGAIAMQVLDGAQTAYDVARANFDAARGAVDLVTPIAGVVTAININIGDLALPGALLATIAKVDRMKVIFNMNETDVTNIVQGQRVSIYSEAKSGTRTEGRIVQLSKSADVRSRSFEMKALFPNTPERWFKPGMFCKVQLEIAPQHKSLVIPNAAIQSDGNNNRVFVIRGGRSYLRLVDIGVTDGERTVVPRGLAERDTVATVGVNNLKDSSFVIVVSR